MTGAYLRPSYANGPLPRLKPQPERITMMMKRRIRQREARLAKADDLKESLSDLHRERMFEGRLFNMNAGREGEVFEPVFRSSSKWGKTNPHPNRTSVLI